MRILFTLLILSTVTIFGQSPDRYNTVQRPTETTVTIAWRTNTPGIGSLNWGIDANNLSNSLSESASTDKHFFDLSGLQPNTQYFYQTTTDAGFISAVDYFYTSKPDSITEVSFLHYGDCGYDNAIQGDIAGLMIGDSTEFGVVTGDVDQGTGNNYHGNFFGPYVDLVKNTCQYTCIGNHDTYADNADTYLDEFYLPTNNPQQSERYYSFSWGNAKFIILDSNIPYTIGTDQHNFFLDELKCNDRQWLFVAFHHPPWTNAWSPDYYIPLTEYFLYQGNEDMRTDLVPYFEQYNVDFVLNGHSHCYQRGEMNGVKYIISGGAGSSLIDANTNSNSPNLDTEIYTNQYVRFNITGDTATYVSVDRNDVVIDSVTTVKPFVAFRPSITLNGSDLQSTTGVSYTWFLDGIQINGATSQNYTPTQDGAYEVMITNANGCSFTSYPLDYVASGTNSISDIGLSQLSIFPNPTVDYITIKGDLKGYKGEINVKVFNTLGEMLLEQGTTTENNIDFKLDVTSLSIGIYSVEISNATERSTHQFVKK